MRHAIGLNLFKFLLLGSDHRPGEPQSDLVRPRFDEADQAASLDFRTWERWFRPGAASPQEKKYMVLDRVLAGSGTTFEGGYASGTLISSLVCGGLVKKLLIPTKASKPGHVLAAQAADYKPKTFLHLHIDAVEVAALATGNGDVSWEEVKAIGARRILELIHDKWNRRNGWVYSELTSNVSMALAGRDPLRKEWAEFWMSQPSEAFERMRARKAAPKWDVTNIQFTDASIHAHRLMFALAADSDFLVEDRFDEWSLDMATAAIAMFALAWADRYSTFGNFVDAQDEPVYWRAFDHTMLREDLSGAHAVAPFPVSSEKELDGQGGGVFYDLDAPYAELKAGLELTGADWNQGSIEVFLRARRRYRDLVESLGWTVAAVRSAIISVQKIHPICFGG